MSWGKHWSSMYEGSMIGKGACFFAVWGYVISHYIPDKSGVCKIELNPKIIAFLIGEPEKEVARVIGQFCDPDPQSRTKDLEGRKLVKLGEYSYEVVNGAKYRAMRNEEERKEQNRLAQERFRKKNTVGVRRKKNGPPLVGEPRMKIAERNGATLNQLGDMASENLPVPQVAEPVPAGAAEPYDTGDDNDPLNREPGS